MLAEIFLRLKRFFKDLKDAFHALIFGRKKDQEGATTVTEETQFMPDGTKVITVTTTTDPVPTWKQLAHKAGVKIKTAISNFIENPAAAFKKLSITGAGTYLSLQGISAIRKNIINPFVSWKEKRTRERRIWDRHTMDFYRLKRPLKDWEQNLVNAETAKGTSMRDILSKLGVLA